MEQVLGFALVRGVDVHPVEGLRILSGLLKEGIGRDPGLPEYPEQLVRELRRSGLSAVHRRRPKAVLPALHRTRSHMIAPVGRS